MSSLTINEQAASDLRLASESTELRDGNGKLVGVFRPATDTERRFNRSGLHTTAEVFEHLRTLTTDPTVLADLDRHIQELKRRDAEACAAR